MGIVGVRKSWVKPTNKVRRIECVGRRVTTFPWAIKWRRNRGIGGRRFGEDETLLKFVQSISSIGPVGLKKLRLFRGTPVCSRQTPILQPTANGGVGSTVGANRICKRSTFCINCKVQGFGSARFLVVVHSVVSAILPCEACRAGQSSVWYFGGFPCGAGHTEIHAFVQSVNFRVTLKIV
jgi:hypothetical protein